MLTVSVKHYKRTLKNIDDRYNSLVHLAKQLSRAKRLANEILAGLPKDEAERMYNANERLLGAVMRGVDRYENRINAIYKIFETIETKKLKIKKTITDEKITFDFRGIR